MLNRFGLLLVGIFSLSGLSTAQVEDTTQLFGFSIDELLQVDVASNVVTDYRRLPVSVTSIDQQQLKLSGARTLIDAINLFVPGFFVVEDQDDVIAGFRGLAPDNNSKVMLLINGKNLNTEWFWGPPSAILNSTNYDYIERIEVIRGPGAVILGQGALLGVINIITKTGRTNQNSAFSVSGGIDNYLVKTVETGFVHDQIEGYFHFSDNTYEGQEYRNEGYGLIPYEGYKKGFLSESGTRIKRSNDQSIIGVVSYKNFKFNLFYFNQEKDLYNFVRDRNRMKETLILGGLEYKYEISEKLSVKAEVNGCSDNFALYSLAHDPMGGTRENRYFSDVVLNGNGLIPNNKFALGAEFRNFEFGKRNMDGNNFINNIADSMVMLHSSQYFWDANQNKTWGYANSINVYSIFAEDYYNISMFDLFLAFRYDHHPFWGSNISPRLGVLCNLSEKLKLRLSYQTGFRGAVGLHYSGGYRNDGLLSEANFDQVEGAQIPVVDENGVPTGQFQTNIPKTKPESMQSFEFAMDWDILPEINIYGVVFYNNIRNVIDVGVFSADPAYYIMDSIGSDVPGDWNGYWYFKNTQGTIKQYGSEIILSIKKSIFNVNLSHSLVGIFKTDIAQRASMYITDQNHIKAYPANVSRLNVTAKLTEKCSVGYNMMYYYQWYSPRDHKVDGNIMVNLSADFKLSEHFSASFSIANLFGQNKLYPINSNSNDPKIADGAPTYEKTSCWGSLKYSF